MRKEEDENTPDLGPIEDYLHAVATERKLPSLAVGICTLRIEDAAPKLRACWTVSGRHDLCRMMKACCCSAGSISWALRATAKLASRFCACCAFPFRAWTICSAMPLPKSMAKIVAGVFDGDTDALFALMIDSSIDEFMRAR